jgi:hypothetical protein
MGGASSTDGIDEKCIHYFGCENLKGRDYEWVLDVNGNTALEWILGKQGGMLCTGCIWLRIGTSGGSL